MSTNNLKRKASPAQEDTPPQKQKKGNGPASNLIPVGDRKKAVKGVKDLDMLRMLCVDRITSKRKELHFKKLVHAEIDWDNIDHIAKINSWRNQLYGRAGLKAKQVCMWNAKEEAWLELYYHLIIVQGSKEGLMIPRAKDVLEDFNKFFMGKVFLNAAGEETEPREARQHNAFVSKMNRVVLDLKTRLEYMMIGKSGDYYRPVITEPMLDKYQELKAQLEESGVMGEPFTWKVDYESGDDWAANEHWIKFYQGLCNLPALVKQEAEDLDAALDEALENLKVDMNESHVKVEAVSEDEGGKHASQSHVAEQADSDAESNFGNGSSNDTTFVEGDTGLTEPDPAAEEFVACETAAAETDLNIDADEREAEKVDSTQVQDTALNKTIVEVEAADALIALSKAS